jgi:small subunit ribosomal protein S21
MNGVIARDNEPIERLLHRFTKTCEKAGVLSDLKKFRHYEKPSAVKKRKINSAKLRRIRNKQDEERPYEHRTRKR